MNICDSTEFHILQLLATEGIKLHLRKYSAHMRRPHRAGRRCYTTMQKQELGFQQVSHASVRWVSPPACVRQISTERGQSDQRCLQPKSSSRKKVSIFNLNEIKQISYFLPNTKIKQIFASNFRWGFCSCSSLWWFAWAEPKNSPSQSGCMPPRVSQIPVECLESRIIWVYWDFSSTAIQVN